MSSLEPVKLPEASFAWSEQGKCPAPVLTRANGYLKPRPREIVDAASKLIMIVVAYETTAQAPSERCFDLARSVRLHVDSSQDIAARAVGGRRDGLSNQGDETVWSARFLGLRFRMTTQIDHFNYPTRFDDRLTHGRLRRFEHVYRFATLPDGGCAMSDELTVEAPFGPLGRMLERLYLTRRLRHLVARRLERIKAVAESGQWREYLSGT